MRRRLALARTSFVGGDESEGAHEHAASKWTGVKVNALKHVITKAPSPMVVSLTH